MSTIDPSLRIDAVELAVADLPRSADFYARVLGLPLITQERDRAELGADAARPALRLRAIDAPTPPAGRASGLFHVAWLHPSRGALAETVRRIAGEGWRFDGASDHGVSEALYLSDPDGLGIEVYADRPREAWRRLPGGGVEMFTAPLDLDDLLAQAERPTPAVAAGTGIGHVHLKVGDVGRSVGFYRDALGFEQQAEMPSAAFVSAGGYHHHVGLNSWQSAGAPPAPETAPGLRLVRFALGDDAAVDALERSLADGGSRAAAERSDRALRVRDPDGQLLQFETRA